MLICINIAQIFEYRSESKQGIVLCGLKYKPLIRRTMKPALRWDLDYKDTF